MTKITLEKKYTRDNCFIIQEVWGRAYKYDYFKNKNPHSPIKVNYLNDGAVEFWDNKKAINWFIDKLFEKNKKDKKFLPRMMKEHLKTADKVTKLSKKKYLGSIAELKKLINLMEEGTYTFLAFWYSAMDERTPKKIRKQAIAIREADNFYDNIDRLIKNTMEYLHPHTKGLVISILIKEIDSPPNIEILKKRFKNCIMIIDETLKITNLKNFSKNNTKYKFLFPEIPKTDFLHGQVACKGRATGKVRILKLKNKINELLEGEILVSPMTTPDFVPAMKKASAIITDEGGITCHAAIVSRELNKPCVIGTKSATQIFKNGDKVEVDANKGIIKKIN